MNPDALVFAGMNLWILLLSQALFFGCILLIQKIFQWLGWVTFIGVDKGMAKWGLFWTFVFAFQIYLTSQATIFAD
jgi:hypothetical protein